MISYGILVFCGLQLFVAQTHAQTCTTKPGYQWSKEGCRDDIHRSLVLLFDDRDNYDDTDANYLKSLVCKCMEAALAKSHTWFALENLGLCFSKVGKVSTHLTAFPLDPKDNCYGPLLIKSNRTINGVPCVGGQWRAFFYEIKTTSGDSLDEPPIEAPPPEGELLCSTKADIGFYVDVSGSIGARNLGRVIEYLLEFLKRFDFTTGKTRLALVQYDISAKLKLSLEDSASMKIADIRQLIASSIKYTGKSTRTDLALKHAKNLFEKQQRLGVPKTLVIISDGRSWLDQAELAAAITGLKALNVNVRAIAIGNDLDLDLDNLVKITQLTINPTTPLNTTNIIKLKEYDSLISKAAQTLNTLVKTACLL